MIANSCPLCESNNVQFYEEVKSRSFNKCQNCDLVFLSKEFLCSQELEKSRYLEHNNSELSQGYKKFLYNIIHPVKNNQNLLDFGLDYGCGPYPMMSKLLKAEGYQIDDYDPYFSDFKLDFNNARYNFVILCEVIEHFSNPKLEIQRIKSLLLEGGLIYIQTSMLDESINFSTWWYKDDITHVSFFSETTISYICETFNLKRLSSSHKNVIILKSEDNLEL